MLDAAELPLASVTNPSDGVVTSLYFRVSTAGYFMARSSSIFAMPLARSHLVVKIVSPRKRASPPGRVRLARFPVFSFALDRDPLQRLSCFCAALGRDGSLEKIN